MSVIKRDWWYTIFALYNTMGLIIAIIYQIFVSTLKCKSLSTWLICHGSICLAYYLFMRVFYNALLKESRDLEAEYITLNDKVQSLMQSLGCESETENDICESIQASQMKDECHTKNIYSHELGALTFLSVYMSSLAIGLILYSQNNKCEAWFDYFTLVMILGCVLSIIFHACLRCNGIYAT